MTVLFQACSNLQLHAQACCGKFEHAWNRTTTNLLFGGQGTISNINDTLLPQASVVDDQCWCYVWILTINKMVESTSPVYPTPLRSTKYVCCLLVFNCTWKKIQLGLSLYWKLWVKSSLWLIIAAPTLYFLTRSNWSPGVQKIHISRSVTVRWSWDLRRGATL